MSKVYNDYNGAKFNRKRRMDTSATLEFSSRRRYDDDEEALQLKGDKYLGHFTRQKTLTCITVPIDEGVKEAIYYRQVAKAIAELGDQDQVEFEISSPGGYLDGLISILTAMERTNATTVAHINGDCHSAASMLAMNCDVVYVSPYASMLVHFVQFGASGKGTDVLSKVSHIYETCEKLFRNTYKHFLTEKEILQCIEGMELWLTADDIKARLERKFNALDREAKAAMKASKKKKPESTTQELNVVEPDED